MNQMTVAELITLLEAHSESEWTVDIQQEDEPYNPRDAIGIDIDTGDQVVTIACSNPQFPSQTLRTNRLKNELAKYSTEELQAVVAERLRQLIKGEEYSGWLAHIPTLEQVTDEALAAAFVDTSKDIDEDDVGFDEHDHGAH